MYYKGKWQTISCSDYTDFSARPTVTKSLKKVIKIPISTFHQIGSKLVINGKQKYIFCWIIDAKVLCFVQVIRQDVLRLLVGKNILVKWYYWTNLLVYQSLNKDQSLVKKTGLLNSYSQKVGFYYMLRYSIHTAKSLLTRPPQDHCKCLG